MRLEEWEKYLSEFIEKVTLLGEIPISREQHEELEELISELVKDRGLDQATTQLKHRYPACFITYLAFKAAFNDDRGFWGKVAQVMGVNTSNFYNAAHHWGKIFQQIIEQYPNLRRFQNVGGLEYVTPIRLHGGIPAFSLPDYFRFILLPSVNKETYKELPDEEALKRLLEHYSIEFFVDDVVRYFFQYGGEAAKRFFSKCREIARKAVAGLPIPAAERLGLRPYVVQAFEAFLQNPPEPSRRRFMPRLYFAPEHQAFRLLLPMQVLTAEQSVMKILWRIRLWHDEQTVEQELSIPVRLRYIDQKWQSEEKEHFIEFPASHVEISLIGLQDDEKEEKVFLHRTLRILPPGESPLLAFQYEDDSFCPTVPKLPARTLWLFYPSGVNIDFEGEARLVQDLPPFSPPMSQWQAKAWDLQNVSVVRLIREESNLCLPFAVSHDLEPKLRGHTLPQCPPYEDKPLFIGSPFLEIPIHNRFRWHDELSQWKIVLQPLLVSDVSDQPKMAVELYEATFDENLGNVSLSLAPYLGEAPFGEFQVLLSQVKKTYPHLEFRVLPALQIDGLEPYYLPQEHGASSVSFFVNIGDGFDLLSLDEHQTKVQKCGDGWQVTIPPTEEKALLLVKNSFIMDSISIPLFIEICRLKWALKLNGQDIEWKDQLISVSLAQLLQHESPRLHLKTPPLHSNRSALKLELEAHGVSQSLQSYPIAIYEHRSEVQIGLKTFFDTLRYYSDISLFDFILELQQDDNQLPVRLPVLRLRRSLDIPFCISESLEDGRWRLHWYEKHPLHCRRVRVWSVWQPWADPVEIRLPDDAPPSTYIPADGCWEADIPPDVSLPPSNYRVQFIALAEDDLEPLPPFPPEDALTLEMITAEQRLNQIQAQLRSQPSREYFLRFEKACIYHTMKNYMARDTEIQWLCSNWRRASPQLLYALQSWLREKDEASRKAILLNMFRSETLSKVLSIRDEIFVQKYLDLSAEIKILDPENALMVLSRSKQPKALCNALATLIKANEHRGWESMIKLLDKGQICEQEAANVLLANPQFSLPYLEKMETSPKRNRILGFFSEKHPCEHLVVRRGYWVLSDAGWGQIEAIEGSTNQDYYIVESEKPNLHVVLRAGYLAEKALINLSENTIFMKEKGNSQICEDCRRFMSNLGKQAWEKHTQSTQHRRTYPIKLPHLLEHPIVFRAQQPSDPFAAE